MKIVEIFTGHYGSGKTELALNSALAVKRNGIPVVIADADVVNPFFRTAEAKDMLDSEGIRLVAPKYAVSSVDLPTLPAEMNSLFIDNGEHSIIDVGGDPAGARVLGVYKEIIKRVGYEMYVVVNTMRPFTDTKEKIIKYTRDISRSSGLEVTGYISNTNLADETTADIVWNGYDILNAASKDMNIPIKYIAVQKGVDIGGRCDIEIKYIERFMKLPF
ncbi:MAG: hypothetical protein E7315_02725 [Clostridiales bacterium]|nr:hypothetical protein [Clostridiales bacterium]